MNHLWPQNHSMVKNDNCSSTTNDSDNSQLAEEILASALESTSSEKSGHGTVSSPLQSSMTLTQPFSLDNTHDDQTFQSVGSGNGNGYFKPTYPAAATSNAGMKLVVGSEFKPTTMAAAAAPATSSFTYMANLNSAPAFKPSN